MEYICLIFQTVFLLATVFLPVGYTHLVGSKKLYKTYLLFEIISQGLCLIANIILFFVFKEIMVYVLCFDVVISGLINLIFTIYSSNKHYKELEKIILEEGLKNFTSQEIRNYLLEKFKTIYSIKDIEKCLIKTSR